VERITAMIVINANQLRHSIAIQPLSGIKWDRPSQNSSNELILSHKETKSIPQISPSAGILVLYSYPKTFLNLGRFQVLPDYTRIGVTAPNERYSLAMSGL
jgi:hypothetical protein